MPTEYTTMAASIFVLCMLLALASRTTGILMPSHLFSPYGSTFDNAVNFQGPAVFTGFVNFTGGVEGAGGGSLPDPWTNSIDLTGTKTFSVNPTVAGTLANVGIDTSIIGANTPAVATFTGLVVNGPTFLQAEGATVDGVKLSLNTVDPTSARTITFPDADGDVALIQPSASSRVDFSTGTATRTDIFGVGSTLSVRGATSGSSTINRAFLFGTAAYILADDDGSIIEDAVVIGPRSRVQGYAWTGGILGTIVNPVIIAEDSVIGHASTTTQMKNPGIFGGYLNKIFNFAAAGGSMNYDNIYGGSDNRIMLTSTGTIGNSAIVGGRLNKIDNKATSVITYAFLGGGNGNLVESADGFHNYESAIVGGVVCKIQTMGGDVEGGFIAGSYNSWMYHSKWSAIIGGESNYLGTAAPTIQAVILGGTLNTNDKQGAVIMGNTRTAVNNYEFRTSGYVFAAGFTQVSDQRAKQNITDMDTASALETIMAIQVRNYTYHPAFAISKLLPVSITVAGMIAQEVEPLVPGAVMTAVNTSQDYHTKDRVPPVYNESTGEIITEGYYPEGDMPLEISGEKSLSYPSLVPYTVAAIQQLKTNADTGAFTTLSASTSLTLSDGVDMDVGTTTGTKIGTSASQKLAFYGTTPVVQPLDSGSTAGYSIGTGIAINDDTCSTAGIGSTCYTLSDVVKILKGLGLAAL